MEARVIFDVATRPFPWRLTWSLLGLFAIGGVAVVLRRLGWRRSPRILGYLAMASAVIALAYYPCDWLVLQHADIKALRTGHYEVVQGTVENFHPMPDDASSKESFTISGRMFFYSGEDVVTPCFNRTVPEGGQIRAGMMLRVKFTDHCILQIEEITDPHVNTPGS